MATLYLVKGYLDQAATSLADAQALLTALANPSTAANSAIIDRIGGKLEDLVQSDSGEPLTISSIDDAAGTISSWVTDASYTVAVGLGDAEPATGYTYASTPALSVSGSTRTGTLALNSTGLRDALANRAYTPTAGHRSASPVQLWLHIRVALAGVTETVGLLRVRVRAGVLSSTPVDLAADTYMTTAAAEAAFTSAAELAAGLAALSGASTASNSTGDTTLTLTSGQKLLAAVVTFTGSAGTRRIVLADTYATAGTLAAINFVFPATSGIVAQLYTGSTGGTLLASVTSDGTAGTVGITCARGASAWNEPTAAAWLS